MTLFDTLIRLGAIHCFEDAHNGLSLISLRFNLLFCSGSSPPLQKKDGLQTVQLLEAH